MSNSIERSMRQAERQANRDLRKLFKQYGEDGSFGSNFINGKYNDPMSIVSDIAGSYARSDYNGGTQFIGSAITKAASLNPVTAVINTGIEVGNALAKLSGVENKEYNMNDVSMVGLDKTSARVNNFLNSKFNFLGAFAPDYKGPATIQNVEQVSSSHSGLVAKNRSFNNMKGRHIIGGRQLEVLGREHDRQVDTLNNISYEGKRMESNYAPQLYAANNQMIYNGYTPGLTLHKKGGTIPELEEVRSIMQSLQSKKQEIQEPQKFQLGGKMNMIVTGALHARKHNLEELNPKLEGEITKKGIPVVVMNEGGEVQSQQAEVETGEIIMQIDATKTIESYYDEYNSTDSKTEKNKIALECGKYLVDELLKNTDDPDKLIKKTE